MGRSTIVRCAAIVLFAVGCGRDAPPPVVPQPSHVAPQSEPVATEPVSSPAPKPEPPPAEAPRATPIRVLYVEQTPRWEFQYLSSLLTRDPSLLTWTWLADQDSESPTQTSPGLSKIDARAAFASREMLAAYDVVILGEVDPKSLSTDAVDEKRALTSVREFVAQGGGLVFLAGTKDMPTKLAGTPLEDVLPVLFDHAFELAVARRRGGTDGFNLHVTPDGESCPFIDVAGDRTESKRLWETEPNWRQYWAFPVHEVRPGAKVLLERSDSSVATLPVVVSSTFGRGRVLFVGVDELWRTRYDVGDRYFGKFWKGAIRWLGSAGR